MSDVQRVIDAWCNPGPRPDIHRAAQEDLRRRWPVLATALEALATASERNTDG